jgi:hypothetical protein
MKIELQDWQVDLLERIGEKTGYGYLDEAKDNYLDIYYLWNALSDLESKYLDKEESYENYREFVKDNYKQKTLEESYGE